MDFPIFKTKDEKLKEIFDLTDPEQERKYFELKAGEEIRKLREYLKSNSFVAYLLGKKASGKGTYSKIFQRIVAPEKIEHFSVGDMVREVDRELKDEKARKELISFLEKNYRGPYPLKEVLKSLENRSTATLLPTELILALLKREMARREKKALFIDGFPRDLDQVGLSLFFRDLIGYREDPDIFVLIDVPEAVIDARIKFRRVCPKCQTPANLKLLPTEEVGFDPEKKEFFLICNQCKIRMVEKEGDHLGIEGIRERIEKEGKIMEEVLKLHGISKILLRNSIPVTLAKEYVDDYEITPEFYYEIESEKVIIKKRPWIFLDDQKREAFSLLPQPVVVLLIKQMVEALGL